MSEGTMKALIRFFKTTILGGLCVLLPLGACAYLTTKAIRVVLDFMEGFAAYLPIERLGGVVFAEAVALGILLGISFILGLVVRTTLGKSLGGWLERVLLRLLPGYDLFKTLAVQLIGRKDEARGTPVMVRLAATHQVGFLMEENPSGKLTVFVPAVPALSVGALHFVDPEQVERLDASMVQVVNCLTGLGIGSSTLQGPPRSP